ncbi:tRNA lysidine(34) synthetase TilS [Mycoplasma sp. ES3157-GEN-MYC]|uniref:tRNA(Ile)-lysidine synthase n=1 Tax=Mycoplasma miroungigenitalium TaxID=754515 RepID=A0A6M4J9C0_9MOLU|nr:tRNA lysidine(34) synthetase TilS [Mycoplasma miroungigenitalium]MBU4690448.1 tRNA lysidine(34) synthetase TilS [Mycoplasma miroungigenitalium]MBU4691715.1 tRNA lysidine(34) synthetase TilS [Mycoplasma miroungigenitalium]QJR43543.1 tRNA lysidine(34) synthetase TilS [Mycoplasma miroungigenitalium]
MKIKNKKLIAVSGGPDSMFLLRKSIDTYGSENLVVAHINYKTRPESDYETELVKNFCESNNVLFFFKIFDYTQCKGNFENWARTKRYEFFKSVYDKENCDLLIMGHHKDDFLETALMQKNSNREVLFFGIKDKNINFGMNIYRPFIKLYFKDEILFKIKDLDIPYSIDSTNSLPICERNKIRLELQKHSLAEKNELISSFYKKNSLLMKTEEKILKEFECWKDSEYSQDFFELCEYKAQIIYKFIHENFFEIKLSKNKIDSIIQWYLSKNRTSEYILKDKIKLIKKRGKLTNIS